MQPLSHLLSHSTTHLRRNPNHHVRYSTELEELRRRSMAQAQDVSRIAMEVKSEAEAKVNNC